MFDDDDIENLDDEEELGEDQGSSKSLKDIIDEAKQKKEEDKEDDKEKENDKDKESSETDKENPEKESSETNKENPEKESSETDKENPEKESSETNKENPQEQKKPEKEDPDSKAIEDAKNKNDNQLRKGNDDDLSKKGNNNQGKKETPKNDSSNNRLSDNRKNQQNKFGNSEDKNNPVKNAIDKGKKKANDKLKKPESGAGQKAKEGTKKAGEKVGKAAKEGAKKLGKAAKAGLKKLWAALPPQAKIIVLVVLVVLILIFIIIFIILLVAGGTESEEEYINNGTCSYNYSAADSDTMAFLANMKNPVGDYQYSISSPFGWRIHPIYGKGVFHRGIDITGSGIYGKTVYAVQDGKIISITPNHDSAGNWIKIKHSGDYVTEYMHLKSFANGLEVGDNVAKGGVIGYVGNTGESTGAHLDFRIRKGDTYLSPDPFFGISDIGYEQCTNETAKNYGACDEDTRLASKINFQKILNEYNCDSGTTSSGNLIEFLITAEGSGETCTISTGEKLYKAENKGDGTVTAGPGVTNYALPEYKNIIINSNATQYFTLLDTGDYVMKSDTCVPKKVIDEIMNEILNSTRKKIQKEAQNKGITLKEHQVDSLVSLSYNFGSSVISDCIDAYKNYSVNGYSNQYEGLWSYMKQKVNFGTKSEIGHKSRRKAEFELFVTGNYNIEVYGRNISNYDDYNSDNVMSRVK